jgi:hypothetical protein
MYMQKMKKKKNDYWGRSKCDTASMSSSISSSPIFFSHTYTYSTKKKVFFYSLPSPQKGEIHKNIVYTYRRKIYRNEEERKKVMGGGAQAPTTSAAE